MQIVPFSHDHIPAAVERVLGVLHSLRESVPALPETPLDAAALSRRLANLAAHETAVAAVEGGDLQGFLGAFLADNFRDTGRRGAYCPEWGHWARAGSKQAIYRALYRAASARWTVRGCQVHALTLLANDAEARETWFWNGFGLMIVDAVRSIHDSLPPAVSPGMTLRQASVEDTPVLAELEAEHWQHYRQAPIFMIAGSPSTAAEFAELIEKASNSAWIAWEGERPAAYLRCEGSGFGAAAVVASPTSIAITGAFTRPEYRGRQAMTALLSAALDHYRAQGFERCSVDFEAFNPEAAAFWMRSFQPVCYSLQRMPECVEPAESWA